MAPPVIKAGPVTRVCYVCGRQYGLSSFDIHVKQCKKLFLTQEELKPKNERRPLPKTPPGLDGSGGGGSGGGVSMSDMTGDGKPTREMVEEMNRAAQETFNERMEKCENCGRTFAEGRLAIHSKSCRPGQVAKRIDEGAAPRNKKEIEIDYGQASSPQKKAAAGSSKEDTAATPVRPTTSNSGAGAAGSGGGGARPLTGSLASNRRKVNSQDPSSPGGTATSSLQSPLASTEVDVDALKREVERNPSMVAVIQAKLDHWEATTLTTLQEIRDLKQVFQQLKS